MWLAFGSRVRELRNGELVVGSGAEADWRIADADLKPRHFMLTVYDLNASLKPTSKANVVVVNGAQVTPELPRLLNDGDVVLAGSGRFLFSEGEARADESPPPRVVRHVCLVDERTGAAHPLNRRSSGIGRDGSNAIVVADPTVSRFHAEVRREAGGFALNAMGAAGAKVNGQALDGARLLAEGDLVEIGSAAWRFTAATSPGARPAETADPTALRDSPVPTEVRARVVRPNADRAGPRGAASRRLIVGALLLALAAIVAALVWR